MKNYRSDFKKLILDLNERKKELSCLYEINSILKNMDASIEDIFQKIVDVIPKGYQYPEICKAQIVLNSKKTQTKGLEVTEISQYAQIKFEDSIVGEIRVYYDVHPNSDKVPEFLPEEEKLINTIAEHIGQTITMRHFKEMLQNKRVVSEKLNIPIGLTNWLLKMQLNESDFKELLSTKVFFKKGELIFRQDSFADYMVIFTEGLAKIYVEDIRGRNFCIRIIKPYEFIGLSTLFGVDHYGFSASSIIPSSGYLIKKSLLLTIIEQNLKFNLELLKWQSENFNKIFNKMNFLANKQTLGRLAETLIYLSTDIFNNGVIDNVISRKIIAEASGMSVENAVRILSALKNDGVISISKAGIEIKNHELLKTYSIAG